MDSQDVLPRVGCGAAILRDGKLLLIRRLKEPEAGCWAFPGGKIDPFEPAQAAVMREVFEELGLELVKPRLLCLVDQIDRDRGEHWVAPVYLADHIVGEPTLREPEKHSAFGWFDLAELPGPLAEAVRVAVAHLSELQRPADACARSAARAPERMPSIE